MIFQSKRSDGYDDDGVLKVLHLTHFQNQLTIFLKNLEWFLIRPRTFLHFRYSSSELKEIYVSLFSNTESLKNIQCYVVMGKVLEKRKDNIFFGNTSN